MGNCLSGGPGAVGEDGVHDGPSNKTLASCGRVGSRVVPGSYGEDISYSKSARAKAHSSVHPAVSLGFAKDAGESTTCSSSNLSEGCSGQGGAGNSRDNSDTSETSTSPHSGSSTHGPATILSDVCVHEHYSLGEQLGAGRFGTVLACLRKSDGRTLACKIISSSLGARDADMEVEVLQHLRGQGGVVHLEAVYIQRSVPSSSAAARTKQGPGALPKGFLRAATSNNAKASQATPSASKGLTRSLSNGSHPGGWRSALAASKGALGQYAERTDVQEVQIVMERCYGGTIADRLKEQGHFCEQQALRVLHSVLSAIQLLHSHGFVYRDIKDTNFLFRTPDPNSSVVAIDFGLAARFRHGELLEEVAGSPLYIAPEVVRRAYGPQCDVWSAGVLLYQMLCGNHPFQRDSVTAVLKAVTSEGEVDLVSSPWPSVSGQTKQLLHAMLTRDPAARPTPAQLLRCVSAEGFVVDDIEVLTQTVAATSSGEIEAEPEGLHGSVLGAKVEPLGAD